MTKKPLSRYVLTDQLYSLIKNQILSHAMPAGDKINIDKLARDLGVSNIPIRESLFRLASEGLVTIVPFKGMFVAEMNLRDIDEIFEIRQSLEELSVRKAASRIPKELLVRMLQQLSLESVANEGTDMEDAVSKLNEDLHGTILKYAKNENLKQIVASLIERIYRYLSLHSFRIDLNAERLEHETIVRALLDNDIEQAVSAMRAHLSNSHQRLRDNFD
ncbi:GntR family transcriptional regulator [Cohnella lupini]|uniref:GntR family transcriptional regulator n=1 Tax=Cohnella lupini TaxID=1294267 RepID=A0A3D9IN47_9BACL|nr:GntR family transcriptional regulator [Cohnella lupini]RED63204.1 GntR family transcriptional regulator [Cohnella lupini]